MRPSLFLLPTVLVVALAVACQPAADPNAGGEGTAAGPAAAPVAEAEPAVAAPTANDAFRAVGTEPVWMAEVGAGGDTALRVEVDYGQTHYEVAAPTHGPDGWAGAAADSTPIKLSVQRVPCQHDGSGEMADAKAMLTVGTRQLHGCGSFSAAQ